MSKKSNAKNDLKELHVRLPSDLKKKIQILALENDKTLKEMTEILFEYGLEHFDEIDFNQKE